MAINLDTQDLQNYPGTVKRVTVDQEQVVPYGFEGDEQFMLSFSTTAYRDNTIEQLFKIYILLILKLVGARVLVLLEHHLLWIPVIVLWK